MINKFLSRDQSSCTLTVVSPSAVFHHVDPGSVSTSFASIGLPTVNVSRNFSFIDIKAASGSEPRIVVDGQAHHCMDIGNLHVELLLD